MATTAERSRVEDVIWELEMRTPIADTATSQALLGRWALVYASEDATRSSPFFWAFRCMPFCPLVCGALVYIVAAVAVLVCGRAYRLRLR